MTKKKTIDETIEEEKTDVAEELPEEELKKLEEVLTKKIEQVMDVVKENPVNKSFAYKKEEATIEKSVLETDPILRRQRPFVKLSKKMEDFISFIKTKAAGMTEGTDAYGGYLVPEEFNAEVIRYINENAIVRPRARVFNMTRDKVGIPRLNQTSSNFGGVTLYWPAEGEEKTGSYPQFEKVTLNSNKVIGLIPATDELLEDSAVNVANFLTSLVGEAIAYEEDYRFLRGTGSGQPQGIITSTAITTIARHTSSKIVIEDILSMDENFPAWAEVGNGVCWITTKGGITQLRQLAYTTTGYIKLLWGENWVAGMPPTLMGKPVLVTDKLPAYTNAGGIILCNLGYYYIGDRGGLRVEASPYPRFVYDETLFRFVKRVDGQPAIPKAFVKLGA